VFGVWQLAHVGAELVLSIEVIFVVVSVAILVMVVVHEQLQHAAILLWKICGFIQSLVAQTVQGEIQRLTKCLVFVFFPLPWGW